MKTRNLNIITLVLAIIFSSFHASELSAQNRTRVSVRDHRTSGSNAAVKPTNTARRTVPRNTTRAPKSSIYHPDSINNQIMFFDEADAILGKRTSVSKKSPAVKITGSVKTIQISKKRGTRGNVAFRTSSGKSLNAYVSNGRILRYSTKAGIVKGQKQYGTKDIPRYTARVKDKCLHCDRVCIQDYNDLGHPVGVERCHFVCEPVKCDDKRKNGVLEAGKAKR